MSDTEALANRLSRIVGSQHVLRPPAPLTEYAVDGIEPRLVIFPADAEGVSQAVKAVGEAGATVIPRGGGTKMSLGNIPKSVDVVLGLSRLNGIVEHNAANLTVTVQAGLTLTGLRKALTSQGQFLPLDPPQAERATVGGVVAASASGPKRLRYGSARDLVLGMRVVLAGGETISVGGKTVKNVSGYDLNKLFIGSLGTLGLIVEVTFRLLPLPEKTETLIVHFTQLSQATEAVARVLDSELLPIALELLNGEAARRASIAAGDAFVLAVGLEGSPETVDRQVAQMTDLFRGMEASGVESISGEEGGARLWAAVRELVPSILSRQPDCLASRAGLPISQAGPFIEAAEDVARRSGLSAVILARAGVGIVYTVLSAGKGGALEAKIEGLVSACAELESLAASLGGYHVVESVPRPVKESVDVWGKPRKEWALMRALKERFDPQGFLNPGRFVGGI